MTPPHELSTRSAFVTTQWNQVLSARGASPDAQMALGQLCEAYWAPVFHFIRQCNHSEDTARDLTQQFFTQLLAHHGLDQVQQGRGRFRSYLLGAVKHFLADQHDRNSAAKRGGGQDLLPIETKPDTHTTASLQIPDPSFPLSDAFFDRQWALNVIDRSLKTLAAEFSAPERSRQFEVLKAWLIGEAGSLSQSDAARELGLTEGAVKVAIHRLRKHFRELVKDEISSTVDQSICIQEELRYLLQALAHR